jgi:hypothetical protein
MRSYPPGLWARDDFVSFLQADLNREATERSVRFDWNVEASSPLVVGSDHRDMLSPLPDANELAPAESDALVSESQPSGIVGASYNGRRLTYKELKEALAKGAAWYAEALTGPDAHLLRPSR